MSYSNENSPVTAVVHLGSLAADATIPAFHLPKRCFLVRAEILNGAAVSASNSNFINLKLKAGSTTLAQLDTRTLQQGALSANIAKSMALVAGLEEQAAGTDLTMVYDETEGLPEVTTILVPVSMVGSDLDLKGFLLRDDIGSVDVWFDIDDAGGTEPTNLNTAGARPIEVSSIGAADNAATIATKLAAALDADSKFIAVVDADNSRLVRVTSSLVGTRTDVVDGSAGEASGLTFAVEQQGAGAVATALTDAKLLLTYFVP